MREPTRRCPDDGACHHDCTVSCWRVATCAPLTVSGWEDWPAEVKAANPPVPRIENLLIDHAALVDRGERNE